MRVCAEPGCPELVDKGRCPAHRSQREQQRGTRQQRGYGPEHDALRDAYQRSMAKGVTYTCWRCLGPIDPTDWTLGHCDTDRSVWHGPECPPCDYATTNRPRCPHPSHRTPDAPPPGSAPERTAGEVKSAAYGSPNFRAAP